MGPVRKTRRPRLIQAFSRDSLGHLNSPANDGLIPPRGRFRECVRVTAMGRFYASRSPTRPSGIGAEAARVGFCVGP